MVGRLDTGRTPVKTPSLVQRVKLPLWLLWIAPLAFLGLFYAYPLISILQVSFSRSEDAIITVIAQALQSPAVQRVLVFTFWQAALSTLFTLIVGLPGAYLLARFQFPGKSIVQALTGIPFVLPTLVVAAAFNAFLGPRGWLNLLLMETFNLQQPPIQFINTFGAILVAHVFYNTTIVLRMVGDYWSHLDPNLSKAAQILGANRWYTLRYITFPMLKPAILAAALLIFIFDFTSFGAVLVLGGPRYATLEVEIYYQTISLFNLPLAAFLSILQLVCTLGLTILYTRLSARITKPVSLRPRRYTQKRLIGWRSKVFAGGMVFFLLSFLTLPLIALAMRSFILPGSENAWTFSLDYYRELWINRRESLFYVPPSTAINVSLGYAATTVVLALGLGLPAAWGLAREDQKPFSRLFDSLLMLPLGTSAVTLGLGFIVAFNSPPLDLRAAPILIPLAHTLVAFPFVVRSLAPSLRSIRPQLRQAAAVLGASPRQVFRFIDLPMVSRAVLVAATFAFTISLGEFGATALVSRPEYPTVPVMIYRFLSQPGAMNYGQAMALSAILMAITTAGMLAIEKFRIADVGEF